MGVTPAQFIARMDEFIGFRYKFGAEVKGSVPGDADCCLAAGSMVHTDRGPVPIEDVKSGDQVWSFENGGLVRHKVVAHMDQGLQETFAVRLGGKRTVVATANHPLLVARFPQNYGGGNKGLAPTLEWVRLDGIREGDWMVAAKHTATVGRETSLPDGTPITADVAWLMGLFLADGSVSHMRDGTPQGVSWCKYGATRERVVQIVAETWGFTGTYSDSGGVSFSRRVWASMWDEVFGRVTSRTKRVPAVILESKPSIWQAFLDGHATGDGHMDKRGYLSVHMANEPLARELRAMRVMLGHRVSNVRCQKRTRPVVIKGTEVKDAADLWTFETYPGWEQGSQTRMKFLGHRAFHDPALTVMKVLDVRAQGERSTYDLEVEGAHNFVADGVVVHNSEAVQYACRNLGLGDVDGSGNQFAWMDSLGLRIPFAEARQLPAVCIYKAYDNSADNYPPGDRNEAGGIYHIAVTKGANLTTEVCCSDGDVIKNMHIDGRSWYAWATKVPLVDYGSTTPVPPQPPSGEVPVSIPVDGGGAVSLREIRKGSEGRDVREAQVMLTDWGFPLDNDGQFGGKTDSAVRGFQSARGLTSDGIVGERTWQSLLGR